MVEVKKEFNVYDIFDSIKTYLKVIVSNWVYIILVTGLGLCLGYFLATRKKPIYKAQETFMLYEQDKGFTGLSTILGNSGTSSGANNKELLMDLLESRRIIELALFTEAKVNGKKDLLINHLVEIEGLRKYPDYKDFVFTREPTEENREKQDRLIGPLYGLILSNEKSDISLRSGKMTLKFEYVDQEFTKEFIEAHVNALIRFYINRRTEKSQITVSFLEKKKDSVERQMQTNQYAMAGFDDKHKGLVRSSGLVPRERMEQNILILNTMYTNIMNNLETARLTLIDDTPIIQVIDTPKYPLEQTLLSKKMYMLISGAAAFMLVIIFILSRSVILSFLRKEKVRKNQRDLRTE